MRAAALRLSALALLCASTVAQAQIFPEKKIEQPVEPGQIAAPAGGRAGATDPGEQGLMVERRERADAAWYSRLGRPAVAVMVAQRLERKADGWSGTSRLVVEDNKEKDGKAQNRQITVGVERRADTPTETGKADLLKRYEMSLIKALGAQQVAVVDKVMAERAINAKGSGKGDSEYQALAGNAGVLIEVEFVGGEGSGALQASAKNLKNHTVLATARQSLAANYTATGEIDKTTRKLVQRLFE